MSGGLGAARVEAYLERIGVARPQAPDVAGLRALMRAHLFAVPFENLSVHLGEPIELVEDALVEKVVVRRRGGFCYELNGAFAALLRALGYRVSLLSARVFGAGGVPGPPFAHMALRVDLEEPWLVDVGFGAFAHHPLRLRSRGRQVDPAGVFQVGEAVGGDLDVVMDGVPQYRLDVRGYALADFAPACWWQRTWPGSHFTRSLTCSLPTESGRVTLSGSRLIRTEGGRRVERELGGEAEVLEAYRTLFGIELERVPVVAG
ncbi:N-hydroxyarylamine O-acetyltransferase [Thermocatellispora tengchongensis]|uniref:N-hydroxyarylamine O-acetyltransferase n=1 Tax=Thermocatellispora tengchongensis TaxID=1073253 RepID=A0A840PE62_9ACTN|nr:arylamine N-acetyltransferase [Thermocatellispora tengchongensis]MBB5137036.1 N-hydroxyarylamine O-acetyltransferase [Thermocatellispora tengchongensis]